MNRKSVLAVAIVTTAMAAMLVATFSPQLEAQNASAAKSVAKDIQGSSSGSPATVASIQKRVESFLRNSFAWGPAFEIKVGAFTEAPIQGLYQIPVTVTNQGQSDQALVYVSKDGRFMFRGEVQDLESHPLADIQKQIQLTGYATKGPANAKVQVVEFADFQCPSCRQLEYVLRAVLPKYPQIRYVFKDFPLDSIHPWASTAALAGHCALNQSEAVFWKFHDSVYDDQDLISTENASAKLTDIATAAGADAKTFQTCLADPKTLEIVKKSTEEGKKLELSGTPTTFVDGRRIVGPDQSLLEQYIQYDLKPTP